MVGFLSAIQNALNVIRKRSNSPEETKRVYFLRSLHSKWWCTKEVVTEF